MAEVVFYAEPEMVIQHQTFRIEVPDGKTVCQALNDGDIEWPRGAVMYDDTQGHRVMAHGHPGGYEAKWEASRIERNPFFGK